MGDARYERQLARLLEGGPSALSELADHELIQALAALAARQGGQEAYLSNILASEAMNRLDRAHAALMQSNDGLLAVDLDGAGVFANPAAAHMLGWSQHELRGIHIHTLLHEQDDELECRLERALAGNVSRGRANATFTRKDGTTLAVEFSTAPLSRDGETYGVVLAFHPRETDTNERT